MSAASKRQDHRNVIMSKLNLLKSFVVIAMLCTICAKAKGKGESTPTDKHKSLPNIVLIISDDQHWRDYSFMGHEHIRTPNIDRLASQSLVFTHGYVPSSLCCPSLASIITGLYPHQHLITSNDPPLPPGTPRKGF